MVLMLVCGALLLGGVAAAVAWSGLPFHSPDVDDVLTVREAARRFAWYAALILLGGVTAGIAVAGAGGRLAMRLLAVTGGDHAQGKITEADEIVGDITVGGTIGFVLFIGIFGGIFAGAVYLIVRRVLPAGRWAGVLFGLALLVVIGTTVDPLRGDNTDFDIVGPGWLAVLVFTTLAVIFGLALAGIIARLSTWLPLLSAEPRVLVRYAAPAAVAAIGFSVSAVLVVTCLLVVLLTRWTPLVDAVRSRRTVLVGRVLAGGVVLASAPNAVTTVFDIAGR